MSRDMAIVQDLWFYFKCRVTGQALVMGQTKRIRELLLLPPGP